MWTGVVGAMCLVLSAQPVSSPEIPRELQQAMRARLEAVWTKDAAAWSHLTADEFTVVIPEGKLFTKMDRLAQLKTEKPEAPHTLQGERTHFYGNAAVRRFIDGNEWVMEVWIRQNDSWRVVASQVNFAKQ